MSGRVQERVSRRRRLSLAGIALAGAITVNAAVGAGSDVWQWSPHSGRMFGVLFALWMLLQTVVGILSMLVIGPVVALVPSEKQVRYGEWMIGGALLVPPTSIAVLQRDGFGLRFFLDWHGAWLEAVAAGSCVLYLTLLRRAWRGGAESLEQVLQWTVAGEMVLSALYLGVLSLER